MTVETAVAVPLRTGRVTGQGEGPSLTADTGIDSVGDGWLRLTENLNDQASFVYSNTPLPTSGGLRIRFDFTIWRNNSILADGFTVALFDANVTPSAGGYGGSLGYAQRTDDGVDVEGLNGGVVGFGIDTFGNFSRASEGREGGVGQRANSFAIRGSMGEDRNDGYAYITGTDAGALDNFVDPSTSTRPEHATTVEIFLTADSKVSVRMKRENDAEWTDILSEFECSISCPEEVKIGFTAGTGGHTSFQELRNLEVSVIPEPSFYSVIVGLVCVAPGLLRRRHRKNLGTCGRSFVSK